MYTSFHKQNKKQVEREKGKSLKKRENIQSILTNNFKRTLTAFLSVGLNKAVDDSQACRKLSSVPHLKNSKKIISNSPA